MTQPRSSVLWLSLPFALVLSSFALHADPPKRAPAGTIAAFLEDSTLKYASNAALDTGSDVEHLLFRWAKTQKDKSTLTHRLATELRMPESLASQLVELTFQRAAAGNYNASERMKATVAERYIALYRQHRDNTTVLQEAAIAIKKVADCDGARFDALLAQQSDEDEKRHALFDATSCLSLLTPLTSTHADRIEPYLALIDAKGEASNTLHLAALRIADAMTSTPSVAVHAERIRSELRYGSRAEAVRLLPAIDAQTDSATIASLDIHDRLTIAAALWLEHQPELAERWRRLADALPKNPADDTVDRVVSSTGGGLTNEAQPIAEHLRRAHLEALLDRALSPSDRDPFDLLTLHYQSSRFDNSDYWDSVWLELIDAVAARDGYPGLVVSSEISMSRDRNGAIDGAIAECHRCGTRLLDALRSMRGEEAASSGSPASNEIWPGLPDAIRIRMDAQIDATPPWHAQPLPAAWRTPHPKQKRGGIPSEFSQADRLDPSPAWSKRLPPGELVRYAQSGHRIVAITASQSLDPVGEISSGGYWVSISDDDGASFAPPLYTGLRAFSPYTIRGASKLPLIDGDTLQIEVALRRIDPDKVVFPPIMLPVTESRNDLFLRIPLADLRRDSDGDGLTDLAEQAMLLDPTRTDTDGDGLADGIDMMPQVPRSSTPAPQAAAMSTLLNELLGKSFGAIVTTSAHRSEEPASGYVAGTGTDVHHEAGATFLVVPAAYLSGIETRQRMIALSPMQAERLQHTRNALPLRITFFEISRSGDRGIATWTAGWTGGTFLLTKNGESWTLKSISHWIT